MKPFLSRHLGPLSGAFLVACLGTFLLGTASAAAQPQSVSQPTDHLRVFLLTFGPGSDPWEKFGHDAILIQDTDTGDSVAYNWGVFDFGSGISGFLSFAWNFVQGRLRYSMQSEPGGDMLDEYRANNRSILAQQLNLTAAEKLEISARLIANDTDANRYYLYDYFRKNCATMARDAIDQTVNGRVRVELSRLPTNATYRWHDRRTTADTLWLYLFLDYALAHPVDRPLSAWEECFLPGKLAEHLVSVQVPGDHGQLLPLIAESKLLNAGAFRERKAPPAWYPLWLLAAGASFGFAIAFLGAMGPGNRFARWAFDLLGAIWSLFAGSLGALLCFICFSNHDAAKWNENLFQVNPLSLLLVVLLPAAWRWPTAAKKVALVVLALSVFGLMAKLTPWAYQANGPTMALAVPIHAGIAWGVFRLAHRQTRSGDSIKPH